MFIRFLTMLAMLLAPIAMAGGHAAAPTSAQADPHQMMPAGAHGHCNGMDKPSKRSGSGIDCAIACSALPCAETRLAAHPMTPSAIPPLARTTRLDGLHPESDPPPPRSA